MSKRGIPLQWEGNLISIEQHDEPVSIERPDSNKTGEMIPRDAKIIQGSLKIHIEKKGRAGKPVIVLSHFSDPESKNSDSLKNLCSLLKHALACGGTVEDQNVVLLIRDINKVKLALKKLNIHVL